MKKLLEFLLKAIVDHPDDVVVEEKEEEGQLNLNLQANPEDIKIIIGKNGRTIKALRELLKMRAIKEKRKVNLNLNQ
ncbi:RNA-binding protein [Candidatus Shapirobacteria bacterium CG07_land_8_20_14_0_80_39_12]|uniref:RNA-binding protein KhpA n=3 Tax=Microgenomates group TaxID=1794810 RepID=A0A2M6YQ37_9BACT|nr:KH domain-containing protein [Patescibacteria group bacterium]PIU33210.1 MAG: RNA-binding protein [Candidatus Shapirobacteria bacterium CG07_land_8_20_14_0_80_39_12]PJA49138.1 MAG: RNA-binding protein [Candidatus Shapirobacteria bacterium CG_4_9_14_3_um_filter_39_13]